MPAVGVPNNPDGVNSFDHFAAEPAYGEITQADRLRRGAGLAGGALAAGAINAPKRAGLSAKKKPKPPRKPVFTPVTEPDNPPVSGIHGPVPDGYPLPVWTGIYPPGTIQNYTSLWSQVASVPGASPLVADYARRAGSL